MGCFRHLFFELFEGMFRRQRRLQMTVDELSAKLDAALAKATEIKDEQGSIKTLVEGLKASVADLTAQVADLQAQVAAGQPVDLQPLADKLAVLQTALDDGDAVADSVLAGTPSDPNAPA